MVCLVVEYAMFDQPWILFLLTFLFFILRVVAVFWPGLDLKVYVQTSEICGFRTRHDIG